MPVVPLASGSAISSGSGADLRHGLRPEVGSLLGSPAVLQVPFVSRSELDLSFRDFPPLVTRAGFSKSKTNLPSSIADSASVPGLPPDGAPSSSNGFGSAPISGKPSWSSISNSGIVSVAHQPSSHPPVASPVIPPVDSHGPVRRPAADPMPSTSSWASLLKENSSAMKLSFLKPNSHVIDGKVIYSLPPDVALKGAAIWENSLVGFFLDKLPFSLVQSYAYRLWGKQGLSEVLCNGNGFFFFKFSDPTMIAGILEGGPWYFGGRPIFLKAWTPGMNLSKAGCKKVPIWAHFFNVPLELWTAEGLSYIASIVGIPLHADKLTSSLKRLNYARICIEISVDDSLPSSLELELEDGSLVVIHIEYNWVPKKCSVCMEFGHLPKLCKKVSHQAWVPKVSVNPAVPPSDTPARGKRPGKELLTVASLQIPCSTKVISGRDAGCSATINSESCSSGLGGCSLTNAYNVLQEADVSLDDRRSLVSQNILSNVQDVSNPNFSSAGNRNDVLRSKDVPCTINANSDGVSRNFGGSEVWNADSLDPFGTVNWEDPKFDDPITLATVAATVSPADDPLADLDPPATVALGDPKFDDPFPLATVATVPIQASSVSRVRDSSSPPCFGCEDSPSPSSTPLLARKIIIVDEVERKLGRKKKDKKKNGSSGNSRGKLPSISK